jgi:DNA-directed RNA polymerase subunit RPC12/RpoP
MSAAFDIGASLNAFFAEGVEILPENHYTANDIECDICGEAEEADSPEIVEDASISPTAVVQTYTCSGPHKFHKLCLYNWLHHKLHKDENATCPKCRHKLILSKTSLKYDE